MTILISPLSASTGALTLTDLLQFPPSAALLGRAFCLTEFVTRQRALFLFPSTCLVFAAAWSDNVYGA